MKKSILLGVSLILLQFPLVSQEREPLDLVVVLDTSRSMYASREEVANYLIGPLLRQYLRFGDTFHLITFAAEPQTELSRRIESAGDVETIIARLLLAYPLEAHTDFIGALDFTARYLHELPENRGKIIVLITDGEHYPPPNNPRAGLNSDTTAALIEEGASKLRGNGWSFFFIKIPFDAGNGTASLAGPLPRPIEINKDKAPQVSTGTANDSPKNDEGPSADSFDVTKTVGESLAAPVIEFTPENGSLTIEAVVGVLFAEFPDNIGKQSRSFSMNVKIRNPTVDTKYLETVAVLVDGQNRMEKPSFLTLDGHSEGTLRLRIALPEDSPEGQQRLLIVPRLAGGLQLVPESAAVFLSIVESPIRSAWRMAAPYAFFFLGLLLAIGIALLIILALRRVSSTPSAVTSSRPTLQPKPRALPTQPIIRHASVGESKRGNDAFVVEAPPIAIVRHDTRIMLSLWVSDQNTNIGRRNVHVMKAGSHLTIGGGRSDFWIFLVPLPPRIADVRFDGEHCSLVVRRPDFFPDTRHSVIDDCVGRTIRVISEKGYELAFRLDEYEDPLVKLNRFLHSIDIPGRDY